MQFQERYPFYAFAALHFGTFSRDDNTEIHEALPYRRFFTVEPSGAFIFWSTFIAGITSANMKVRDHGLLVKTKFDDDGSLWGLSEHQRVSPLQLASSSMLVQTTRRLLEQGSGPNELSYDNDFFVTPLLQTISNSFRAWRCLPNELYLTLGGDPPSESFEPDRNDLRRIEILKGLVSAEADVNRPVGWDGDLCGSYHPTQLCVDRFSPLCVAIMRGASKICEFLLDNGASVGPDDRGLGTSFDHWRCILSINCVIESADLGGVLERIITMQMHPTFIKVTRSALCDSLASDKDESQVRKLLKRVNQIHGNASAHRNIRAMLIKRLEQEDDSFVQQAFAQDR